MPWYLYLALKQLFPTGRRLTFFTFMSAVGIAVGVMMLIVATSIMSGFGQGIRGMIVDTEHPRYGRMRSVASPVRVGSRLPGQDRRAPLFGEHTDAVLRELGYDQSRIARLRSAGAFGQHEPGPGSRPDPAT